MQLVILAVISQKEIFNLVYLRVEENILLVYIVYTGIVIFQPNYIFTETDFR